MLIRNCRGGLQEPVPIATLLGATYRNKGAPGWFLIYGVLAALGKQPDKCVTSSHQEMLLPGGSNNYPMVEYLVVIMAWWVFRFWRKLMINSYFLPSRLKSPATTKSNIPSALYSIPQWEHWISGGEVHATYRRYILCKPCTTTVAISRSVFFPDTLNPN